MHKKLINKKINQNNRGYTLVEMLVSVAIFSIVVLITLGAILTILDANRKARTLTEVMNNLNFTVEMMTRSLKTGVEPVLNTSNGVLHVDAIILDREGFQRERTSYRLSELNKRIEQCVSSVGSNNCDSASNWIPITSEAVVVEKFQLMVVHGGTTNDNRQPRTLMLIEGSVKVSDDISSAFSLQTTVSQRRLNLTGSETSSVN